MNGSVTIANWFPLNGFCVLCVCVCQALENAKQSLIRLNCLLHIRWPADETPDSAGVQPKPVVYRLEEIERRHLEMLQLLWRRRRQRRPTDRPRWRRIEDTFKHVASTQTREMKMSPTKNDRPRAFSSLKLCQKKKEIYRVDINWVAMEDDGGKKGGKQRTRRRRRKKSGKTKKKKKKKEMVMLMLSIMYLPDTAGSIGSLRLLLSSHTLIFSPCLFLRSRFSLLPTPTTYYGPVSPLLSSVGPSWELWLHPTRPPLRSKFKQSKKLYTHTHTPWSTNIKDKQIETKTKVFDTYFIDIIMFFFGFLKRKNRNKKHLLIERSCFSSI